MTTLSWRKMWCNYVWEVYAKPLGRVTVMGLGLCLLMDGQAWSTAARVDLRAFQTAGLPSVSGKPAFIRNQGGRNTCITFAATAALEAAYKRAGYGDLDLSEEFINYLGKLAWLHPNWHDLADKGANYSENQLAAFGGGNGFGYIVKLTGLFATVDESQAPYASGYDLSDYCAGCEQWTHSYWATQRHVNTFNLVDALPRAAFEAPRYYGVATYKAIADPKSATAFEAVLQAGYEIVWDFAVQGATPPDAIWRPQTFEETVTVVHGEAGGWDALPRGPVVEVRAVRYGTTLYRAGQDFVRDGDGISWRPRGAEPPVGAMYSVTFRHENNSGSHAALIVGYDRTHPDPAQHYFIVKNSWGPTSVPGAAGYTLISHDYLKNGHSAGYITAVRPPRQWPELRFFGRWSLSFDGWRGELDIYHLPGMAQGDFDNTGLGIQDRRIGTFFDGDGNAFRVNGSISGNHIVFYFDNHTPNQRWDTLLGRRFTYYLFGDDPTTMAGFHRDGDGTIWAGYARQAGYLQASYPSPVPLSPTSFLGHWRINIDGAQGELFFTRRLADAADEAHLGGVFIPTATAEPQDLIARVSLQDPARIHFKVDMPERQPSSLSSPWLQLEGRMLSWENGVFAGHAARTRRVGILSLRNLVGFHAVRLTAE